MRPRYLRTYARTAPVNRAKRARLRLDCGPGFDELEIDQEEEGDSQCRKSEIQMTKKVKATIKGHHQVVIKNPGKMKPSCVVEMHHRREYPLWKVKVRCGSSHKVASDQCGQGSSWPAPSTSCRSS